MALTKKTELVEIRPLEIAEASIHIEGDSPLIVHAWSAKAKREMLEKQIGASKAKSKTPKDPYEDFCSSLYWLDPMPEEFTEEAVSKAVNASSFGFPVTAIKQAAISTARRMGWSKDKVSLKGAFFIKPEFNYYYGGDLQVDLERKTVQIVPNVQRMEQLFVIRGSAPVMREDMVKLGGLGNPADIRYRGMFEHWSADLTIQYNSKGVYSLSDLINMINAAGLTCGIGEWRPEKDGQYGMFHVATDK